jgi:tetratricopeptide (TPR) repeat protein
LFEKEKTNHIQNAGKIVILQSALLFILIFGLFSYPFDKLPFVALFVCFLASLSRFRQPVFEFESKKTNVLRILLLFVLCLMSGAIACNAYSYADTCRAWNRALANFGIDREKSLSQLKKLYPELKNNSVFLTTYGKALSFGEYHQEATVVLEKAVARQPLSLSYIELGKSYEAAGFPEKALACWKHAGWMVPARFAPLYLAMKLHFKNGEYDRAKEYAGQLLAKKIKIDSPEIDQMKREAEELRAKN